MILDFEIEGHIMFIRNLMLGLIFTIIGINLILSKVTLNKYIKKTKDGFKVSKISKSIIIANTLLAVIFGALTMLVVLSNDKLEGMTMIVYLTSFTVYLLYVVRLYHAYTHFKFSLHLTKNYIEVLNSNDNYKIYMESIKRIDKVSGYYIIYYNDEDKIMVRRNMEGLDSIIYNNLRGKHNIQFNF